MSLFYKYLGLAALLIFLSSVSSLQANYRSLERAWGISPLNERFQHPLESIQLATLKNDQRKVLIVNNWYEDNSVTKGAIPEKGIYCRFMHSFLYGRAQIRGKSTTLPPQRAFDSVKSADAIRFQFIAVQYHNKPTNPFWDKRPASPPEKVDENAKLRVLWSREETVTPYLSLDVTRKEWMTVASLLKSRPYYGYTEFRTEACDNMYRLLPRVRSNFSALDVNPNSSETTR